MFGPLAINYGGGYRIDFASCYAQASESYANAIHNQPECSPCQQALEQTAGSCDRSAEALAGAAEPDPAQPLRW